MKYIQLTQGFYAKVDCKDYYDLIQYNWFYHQGYATRQLPRVNGVQKTIRLHRYLMTPTKNLQVDHINGNTLDNRRENLRICTQKDNTRNRKKHKSNTSGYKGVSYSKRLMKFVAGIKINGKRLHLGVFDSAMGAAKAYNKAAFIHFREFSRLNNEKV